MIIKDSRGNWNKGRMAEGTAEVGVVVVCSRARDSSSEMDYVSRPQFGSRGRITTS